jgi:hypothetical protein
MLVEMKLSSDAAHSPALRPNLLLNGPTERELIRVPIVTRHVMSCWTVGFPARQLGCVLLEVLGNKHLHRYSMFLVSYHNTRILSKIQACYLCLLV